MPELIRSRSCPIVITSEPITAKKEESPTTVVLTAIKSLPSQDRVELAKSFFQNMHEKYVVPAMQEQVASELLETMAKEQLSSVEEAVNLIREQDPEKAFRMWCNAQGEVLPDDLSDEPVRVYLLMCEWKGETPDADYLAVLKEAEKPKTMQELIQRAQALVKHSGETSLRFAESLASITMKLN